METNSQETRVKKFLEKDPDISPALDLVLDKVKELFGDSAKVELHVDSDMESEEPDDWLVVEVKVNLLLKEGSERINEFDEWFIDQQVLLDKQILTVPMIYQEESLCTNS